MNRKILIPALALAIVLLSGCGASSGGTAEASRLFGRNILFTRAASDEEVFAGIMKEAGEEFVMGEAVPLASPQEDREEGWLLVCYSVVNGETKPMWFHVWNGESWSGASGVGEEACWPLSAGAPEMSETQTVRPLG